MPCALAFILALLFVIAGPIAGLPKAGLLEAWPLGGRTQSIQPPHGPEIIVKLVPALPSLFKPKGEVDPSNPLITAIASRIQIAEVKLCLPETEGLGQFLLLRTSHETNLSSALIELGELPEIEYAQLNHTFGLDGLHTSSSISLDFPDDSLFAEQWGLEAVQAPTAWQVTKGSAGILVAVIDTGVELDHPDLRPNLWINPGEDLNLDGVAQAEEFNSVDDDGNGYIDDLHGWDFTDAPNFPDGGDYLERDPFPADEHGHGTAVAGIIAAVADNQLGVAGVAPECRVMVLRAGNSQGLLEEDDVASAILYAVANGARVINMSFGDIVVSPMLRDVVSYAYAQGAVLVASAGNSASDTPHYPSAFSETISVGAITPSGQLTLFSNFGATLDLVAPGSEIWSTYLGKTYSKFTGTSAAAPFVSAIAALLLSRSPAWSNETVRAALENSATDLGEPGWDPFFGAGKANAATVLQLQEVSRAEIHSPQMDAGFSGNPQSIVVRGTALGAFVTRYQIAYGVGQNPEAWNEISSATARQVLDDSLGVWQLENIPDTTYVLRLRVEQQTGTAVEDKVTIHLDRTPPAISNLQVQDMIEGSYQIRLIEFQTDDLCKATLWFRPADGASAFTPVSFNYVNSLHRLSFTPQLANGHLQFYLEAVNRAGLSSRDDNNGLYHSLDLSQLEVNRVQFVELPIVESEAIPAGHLLSKSRDFNHDGSEELVLSIYSERGAYGPLSIFARSTSGFALQSLGDRPAIPRDIGDSDGDGLAEILAGYGPTSFIYEAAESKDMPTRIVWADSSDFWASRFADVDADGKIEIIAIHEDVFGAWENNGDHSYVPIATFPNLTAGLNLTGSPHSEIGDFDGDGRTEILLGDFDGDLYIYEATGDNQFIATWSDRMPLLDTIDFIGSGDYDGDGRLDFAAGCHSSEELNSEHEFDGRYWLFRIYRAAGDNVYEVAWEQNFFGFQSPQDFDAGTGSGDIDNDGRDELFLNLFPDGYVIDFDENGGEVIWHYQPVRSNATTVAALNGEGTKAFCFSDGERIRCFQPPDARTGAPAPTSFQGRPLDANRVALNWQATPDAEGYAVFRATLDEPDTLLAVVTTSSFLDQGLVAEQSYRYTVATVDSQSQLVIGPHSRSIEVTPSAPPAVVSATYFKPHHVAVLFSEPMAQDLRVSGRFRLSRIGDLINGQTDTSLVHQEPASITLARSGHEALLAFPEVELVSGRYLLEVTNVADQHGVPLDLSRRFAGFTILASTLRFYLVSAELKSPTQVQLQFNAPVDHESATNASNYSVKIQQEPEKSLTVASATVLEHDPASVSLNLATGRIAALGRTYLVKAHGVRSAEGLAIEAGQGDAAGFAPVSHTLENLVIFPNPFEASRHNRMTIGGLPRRSSLKVLDELGRVVFSVDLNLANGGFDWDTRDNEGRLVPSGVYVCFASSGAETVWTKFVIVR